MSSQRPVLLASRLVVGEGAAGIAEVRVGAFLVAVPEDRSQPLFFRVGALFLRWALMTPVTLSLGYPGALS